MHAHRYSFVTLIKAEQILLSIQVCHLITFIPEAQP